MHLPYYFQLAQDQMRFLKRLGFNSALLVICQIKLQQIGHLLPLFGLYVIYTFFVCNRTSRLVVYICGVHTICWERQLLKKVQKMHKEINVLVNVERSLITVSNLFSIFFSNKLKKLKLATLI